MSNELDREIATTLDLVSQGTVRGAPLADRLQVLIERALAEQREGIAQDIAWKTGSTFAADIARNYGTEKS